MSTHLAGGFLFFLGLSAMWLGASVMVYGNPEGAAGAAGASCRAICGLAMLAALLLGPVAGHIVGGGLTLLAGLALAWVGRALYQT